MPRLARTLTLWLFPILLATQITYAQDDRSLGDVAREVRATKHQTASIAEAPAQPTGSRNLSQRATKVDPAKEADIRRLLEVTGTKSAVVLMMTRMEKNVRPLILNSLPPGDYRERLINLFFAKFHSSLNLDQLLDMAIPVYDKYFSDDEIKGLIEFYESPLGQKATSIMPKLSEDMEAASRTWGMEVGRDCMRAVLAENPDLAKALTAAKTSSH